MSAESTADQALIKELISTSDYKFLLPAAQNKLTSISNLSLWFITITKMLARFDAEAFLFGTTASLNNVADLKLRTIKLEDKGVKLERVAPTSMDIASKVLEELRSYFVCSIRTFPRSDFVQEAYHSQPGLATPGGPFPISSKIQLAEPPFKDSAVQIPRVSGNGYHRQRSWPNPGV